MTNDKKLNREIANKLYNNVDFDVSIITVAVSGDIIKEATLHYSEWLGNEGWMGMYYEISDIVDELMFGKDSEYIKALVYAREGELRVGDYFNEVHNNCFDWYFMYKGLKMFEERLKGKKDTNTGLNNYAVEQLLSDSKALKDVMDGESTEEMIKELGMEEQMLRQLIMSADESMVADLLAEKLNNK